MADADSDTVLLSRPLWQGSGSGDAGPLRPGYLRAPGAGRRPRTPGGNLPERRRRPVAVLRPAAAAGRARAAQRDLERERGRVAGVLGRPLNWSLPAPFRSATQSRHDGDDPGRASLVS